ncbi:ATP-dependent DNA helicase [Trichonephila inaurata madagascariensis]|uniref:ATP-dependent DNA helicase n=1 Tax=Trichonephila inaurata madagascariensis TaxID=2747483 RepID=A0A8X6XVG9_9ARAC|nr:ATP-dependent DNA helicase [Trichonephila inaurata madagascariensis]
MPVKRSGKSEKKGVPHADFPRYVTDNALGRVYTVHPKNREAFLRLLLLPHVRGPISFEDLKTVIVRDEDGDILEIKPCSTYTEACQVLGLLEDDSHWYQAMEEAAVSQSPAQLRNLFAILVAVCGLNKPITLWENHKEDMTEDFLHQARRNNPTENIEYCDLLFNNTFILKIKFYPIMGNKFGTVWLARTSHDQPELTSKDVLRETSYDVQALLSLSRAFMAANAPRLTPDQQQTFIAITGMIGSERGGIVFLDAPGGTVKTFLLNLQLAFVRKEKDMAVPPLSIDCILNDDEAVQYPIQFLNSIQTPDLQAHNLILKVGAPIMLIRNIDAPRLCNGTRLIVKKLMQHVIQATVLTGCAKDEDVFIPRIHIIPSDNTIQFKR